MIFHPLTIWHPGIFLRWGLQILQDNPWDPHAHEKQAPEVYSAVSALRVACGLSWGKDFNGHDPWNTNYTLAKMCLDDAGFYSAGLCAQDWEQRPEVTKEDVYTLYYTAETSARLAFPDYYLHY